MQFRCFYVGLIHRFNQFVGAFPHESLSELVTNHPLTPD